MIEMAGTELVKAYPNKVTDSPKVSVVITTYNHEKYIRECLEGILAQKTDFRYEIILGEDDSVDKTREICIEYAEQHPDMIRLFLHNRANVINIRQKPTGRYNFLYNINMARGKFIALCEGDDYWTDTSKLARQVKCLEEDHSLSFCFHSVETIFDGLPEHVPVHQPKKERLYFRDLIKKHYVPTLSILFRNENLDPLFSDGFKKIVSGDIALYLLLANRKPAFHFSSVMGVKRKNPGGVSIVNVMSDKSLLFQRLFLYAFIMRHGALKNFMPLVIKSLKLMFAYLYRHRLVLIAQPRGSESKNSA
jgi:glycosyltransferase involved in cell wall biosynthesis